jgi:hypothetical protein
VYPSGSPYVPSCTLVGGGKGNYGPRCTQQYISGYY